MNTKSEARLKLPLLGIILVSNLLAGLSLAGCNPNSQADGTPAPPENALKIDFAYSSEKKPWIEPLAAQFNKEKRKLPGDSRPIFINAFVADSGTARAQIADKSLQPTVWSPSNSLWKSVLNFESDTELAGSGAGESDPLLLTPVVMAMWKPMAEALGWPSKSIGLKEVLELNNNPAGWGSAGHAEWGQFKYAHTNPEVSSTGLSTVAAEFYAGAGKTTGLTQEDIEDPKVREFVRNIEKSIVHYSATTTIFKENVRKGGMDYISAVALEEVTLIELNKTGMPVSLVAIYPKEGTFWHDNPYIILKAAWVTDDQRKAAATFRDYLLEPERQQQAITLGFRPANPNVNWRTEPFTKANGIDPDQPKTTLQVPSPRVLVDLKNAWGGLRKEANVVLVLDVSGSMDDQDKLVNALEGLRTLVEQIRDVDRVGLVVFSQDTQVLVPVDTLSTTRPLILDYINNPDKLPRSGSTAIYDGVAGALDEIDRLNDKEHINAVVLLTDGKDNASQTESRLQVPNRLRANRNELWGVKLFPIAYGKGEDVDVEVLQQFADDTQTRMVTGDVTNIKKIYQEISGYF